MCIFFEAESMSMLRYYYELSMSKMGYNRCPLSGFADKFNELNECALDWSSNESKFKMLSYFSIKLLIEFE